MEKNIGVYCSICAELFIYTFSSVRSGDNVILKYYECPVCHNMIYTENDNE